MNDRRSRRDTSRITLSLSHSSSTSSISASSSHGTSIYSFSSSSGSSNAIGFCNSSIRSMSSISSSSISISSRQLKQFTHSVRKLKKQFMTFQTQLNSINLYKMGQT